MMKHTVKGVRCYYLLFIKRPIQIFSVCLEDFKAANVCSLKSGSHAISVLALVETFFRCFKIGATRLIIRIKPVLFVFSHCG